MSTEAIPQEIAQRMYIRMLAGDEPEGELELRWTVDGGMGRRFYPAHDPKPVTAALAQLSPRTNTYLGIAPRREVYDVETRKRTGGKRAIARMWVLYVDADSAASQDKVRNFPVTPSMLIRSGRGVHAIWSLKRPATPAEGEAAIARLIHHLDADPCASEAARVLRPPMTFNHKTTPALPVVCESLEILAYTLDEVVGDLADPPAVRSTQGRNGASRQVRTDVLDQIPASEYVPLLTGRELGRDLKVACPFHSDSTPSLHAYGDARAGFYCFGCGAGGSIIDFGARLYGIKPRDAGFHEIRRRLAIDLLERAA